MTQKKVVTAGRNEVVIGRNRGRPTTGRTCRPHMFGVEPGQAPFYDPDCPMCRRRLLAGLVTGAEPLPVSLTKAQRKRRHTGFMAGVVASVMERRAGR